MSNRDGPGARHGPANGDHQPSRLAREEEADLTEVAAPAPAQREPSSEWQSSRHLESAESEEAKRPPPPEPPEPTAWLTQLYILSYLVFFSIWGVLARLGVQWITFYPGAPITIANLWANTGGSFFMGFLSEDRRLFREEWGAHNARARASRADDAAAAAHSKAKKTIPLYIGLTVGFCGSFTSFSSFMRDVFEAVANDLPAPQFHPINGDQSVAVSATATLPRSGGYSFLALLAIVLVTIAMSMSALVFGGHLALALQPVTPTIPFRFTRFVLDPLVVLLGWGCWLGAILLTVFPPDRPGGPEGVAAWPDEHWRGQALFSLVFAPVGCLLRFALALKLNGLVPSFPLGTFAANIFGVAVFGMCHDLQHVAVVDRIPGGGVLGCQVLQGMLDGFCGALTTISTWVGEIRALRLRHAYFYCLVSVVVGFCFSIVIMGSVRWTIGFSNPACVMETA